MVIPGFIIESATAVIQAIKGQAMKLYGSSSGYAGFKPAASAGSTLWQLPASDAVGVFTSDGSGNLSVAAVVNISGNAATVTTNANLTGPITSSGNATSIASQTGTGTTFAVSVSPAFTGTPTAPTAAVATNTTQIATTAFVIANAGGGSTLTGKQTINSAW